MSCKYSLCHVILISTVKYFCQFCPWRAMVACMTFWDFCRHRNFLSFYATSWMIKFSFVILSQPIFRVSWNSSWVYSALFVSNSLSFQRCGGSVKSLEQAGQVLYFKGSGYVWYLLTHLLLAFILCTSYLHSSKCHTKKIWAQGVTLFTLSSLPLSPSTCFSLSYYSIRRETTCLSISRE